MSVLMWLGATASVLVISMMMTIDLMCGLWRAHSFVRNVASPEEGSFHVRCTGRFRHGRGSTNAPLLLLTINADEMRLTSPARIIVRGSLEIKKSDPHLVHLNRGAFGTTLVEDVSGMKVTAFGKSMDEVEHHLRSTGWMPALDDR
jgi:hypothetical protein